MADIGYVDAFTTHRHRVYEPRDKVPPGGFGEHVDNPLKIEIHAAVAEPLPVHKVDITARLSPGRGAARTQQISRPHSLLLHLLLHAAGNMRAHALRQIQLHDIAGRTAALGPRLAHDARGAAGRRKEPWWLFPPSRSRHAITRAHPAGRYARSAACRASCASQPNVAH